MTTVTRFLLLLSLTRSLAAATSASTSAETSPATTILPLVVPTTWLPPNILRLEDRSTWKPVTACCLQRAAGTCAADSDNDDNKDETTFGQFEIGSIPQFTTEQSLAVLDEALAAWNHGAGTWTQMTIKQRIECIQNYFTELSKQREEIVNVLMWEIGKNRGDAEAEFDRTLAFGQAVIQTIQTDPEFAGAWQTIGTTKAYVRRNSIGIFLILAPYNYPLNESYACLIPLLLMGNVCILKIPSVGGLVHLLTMEALAKSLPPGTINFVAGSGRATMPPLMETGQIDGLAFIGGSKAADDLIQKHPQPHRLKIFLQLEAKNMAIYLPDLFAKDDATASVRLQTALDEAVVGSLSYNGQRCTALKLHFVPKQHADTLVQQLAHRVEALRVGLPDQKYADNQQQSQITPLPTKDRITFLKGLIDDAVSKGAKIVNQNGGQVIGGPDSTLIVPAVLYPVTTDMKVYTEEQFGPIIPVVTYGDIQEVLELGQKGEFGQQVSIFGKDVQIITSLVDGFSAVYAKINLNQQCGRSPDTLPFAGRRSSAMGVMSVKDALREFSIPTVVAYKQDTKGSGVNEELQKNLDAQSNFLQTL